jgi:hypothetical protein
LRGAVDSVLELTPKVQLLLQAILYLYFLPTNDNKVNSGAMYKRQKKTQATKKNIHSRHEKIYTLNRQNEREKKHTNYEKYIHSRP